jgi:hypothetical protein
LKLIELTQNKVAIVDDDDFELVNKYKWHYSKASKNYGRAKSTSGIAMHRLIMKAEKGQEIDHINGNTLDNRKTNLRFVTHFNNQKNMKKSIANKSGYKGVSWHNKAKKWQSHIMIANKNMYLGLFNDVKEAAKAYNIKAIEHFGEFAKLNEILY